MIEQQDKLNGSMTAFARAFSDVVRDATSHLATKDEIAKLADNMATKDDINQLSDRIDRVEASLNGRIDITNQNMQAQFAQQEKKIAEIDRKLDNMNKAG